MSVSLPSPRSITPRAASSGWLIGATVYLLAVLHRTSLGVAGLQAQQRFAISAAQLSVFIFLQLGVYAAMQVPTGVLVDRYGPRRLLITAALTTGTAQLLFALIPSYPAALAARAVLGAGDALTFVSILRFTATHFEPRRYPLLVSATATLGMLGNVVATLPLALFLHRVGWAPAFASTASLSLVAAVAVWRVVPDSTPPPRAVRETADLRLGVSRVWSKVRAAWSLPGTRLGFWVHFACMSTATAFAVLWGSPYLVKAVGLSQAQASVVLMGGVLLAAMAAPGLGWLTGHRPALRVPIGLAVTLITVVGFLVLVFALGDHPPAAYVVPLFVFMALGGPTSMAAFALARDYNHARTLGTASGVVNVGGFLATVLIALGIGWALDLQGGTTAHTLRWAALVAIGVQVLGAFRLVVWFRRVRAQSLGLQHLGEPVPVSVVRHRWDLPAA